MLGFVASTLLLAGCCAVSEQTNSLPADTSKALTLVQLVANDIEALKPQFAELADFPASNHLTRARIDYRHNVDYVEGTPKGSYSMKQGGCLIAIEAWDAQEGGWPGMRAGPNILSIDRTLANGVHIMATIEANNENLRQTLADTIARCIQAAK